MASDLNTVVLIGRLTRDAETKQLQSGTPVTTFSIANNYEYGKSGDRKSEVNYFDCKAWGKIGEVIEKYCSKGDQIMIQGRLSQQRWEHDGNTRSKIEIIVNEVQFLGKKRDQ